MKKQWITFTDRMCAGMQYPAADAAQNLRHRLRKLRQQKIKAVRMRAILSQLKMTGRLSSYWTVLITRFLWKLPADTGRMESGNGRMMRLGFLCSLA